MRRKLSAQSPGQRFYWTGMGLATFLSAALLLLPALQSLTTFVIRLHDADVMLGAVGNANLLSRVSLDLALFVLALLVLHGLLAILIHTFAVLTEVAWPQMHNIRNGLIVAWFSLVLAAVLLLNADWFPRSHAGSYYATVASRSIGSSSVAWWVTILLAGLAAVVVAVAFWRLLSRAPESRQRAPVLCVAAVVLAGFVVATATRGTAPAEAMPGRANVVILGVDSLRLSELHRFGGEGWTPNIDAFLEKADVFSDSTTPLARTFPSWMAILTGRSPRSTGAVFNLIRREDVNDSPTVADLLKAEGYTTVYATDEVRFSNIDESYGFDQVITPPIGAADFLIGQVGDLPLSNVIANTRLGAFFLRYLYANRGVAFLYRPETFIDRLRNELPDGRPVLAAIHLTAAHWPYFHAGTPLGLQYQPTETSSPAYRESLQTADRMFRDVVDVLQSKGILHNALIVVLSDHGEALGIPSESLIHTDGRVAGLKAHVEVSNWGHGQSVLSPVQYKVLLGFRGFGVHAKIGAHGRDLQQPATLEDVVPTLMDLLSVRVPEVDGISLARQLRSVSVGDDEIEQRIRFTETDIVVTPSDSGELEGEDAARQVARLLQVDPASGWLQLRPAMIGPLLDKKERAALDETHLLAAMPIAPDGHQYLLLDRQSGRGRVLLGRPDSADPGAQGLWDALHRNFAGELKSPLAATPTTHPQLAHQQIGPPSSNEGAMH